MPAIRLRRVFMKDVATGKEDIVLAHCVEGEEMELALHLHLLGVHVGRRLNVRVTSVAGKALVDLQVFYIYPMFVLFL